MKIILWNVKGMRMRTNREKIENQLLAIDFDIAVLTETNIQFNSISLFRSHTKFTTLCSTSSELGSGVCVILNETCKLINEPVINSDGRMIQFCFQYLNFSPLHVIALYAPAKSSQRTQWFAEGLFKTTKQVDLLLGDFNFIEDKRDTNASNPHIDRHLVSTFKQFLSEHSLVDILPHGVTQFTFSHSNGTKFRLDRIYARTDLLSLVSNVNTLTPVKSDHKILQASFDLTAQLSQGRGFWRLQPSTVKNVDVIQKINKKLSELTSELNNTGISSVRKWIIIKEECRKIYVEEQNRLSQEERELENRIKALLRRINLSDDNLNTENLNNLSSHFNQSPEIEQLIEKYENLLKQRINKLRIHCQLKRDVESELSCKFLSNLLKKRASQRLVYRIRHPTTYEICSTNQTILKAFYDFYSNLYKKRSCDSEQHRFFLSHWNSNIRAMLSKLAVPITLDEVLKTIDSTNGDKSPGPDGLSGWFYKTHKLLVAPILLDMFNDFIQGNPIPSEMKKGIITTIFKKGDPLDLNNRRPITLLNVDYKIFSKLLTNRIKAFLPSLISNHQQGFVPRRLLFDNIILLDSVFQLCKTDAISSPILTFIDFRKAFDTVSHDSIIRTLEHLAFPQSIITTIWNMLSDTFVQVLVNGFLTDPIRVERGTKQGDPISPLLFVLVIEALSRTIQRSSSIAGLPFSSISSTKLKILLFAADVLLFSSNRFDLDIAMKFFHDFAMATGLEINKDKSKHIVPFHKWSPDNLPFQMLNKGESEKYLGFNFDPNGLCTHLESDLNSVLTSLTQWKKHKFTLLTKVKILKTFIYPKLAFHLYCEPLKSSPCSYFMFDKIVQWFLWSKQTVFEPSTTYKPRVSMRRLQQSKSQGGLDLWSLRFKHMSFKIWLLQRALKDTENKILYSSVWKKEFQLQSPTSQILQDAVFVNIRFNFQLNQNTILSTQDIYRKFPLPSPQLTPSQQIWMKLYNVDFGVIFNLIHNFRYAPRIKDFLWRLYSKALPLFKGHHDYSFCEVCNTEESTLHIFFECSRKRSCQFSLQFSPNGWNFHLIGLHKRSYQ